MTPEKLLKEYIMYGKREMVALLRKINEKIYNNKYLTEEEQDIFFLNVNKMVLYEVLLAVFAGLPTSTAEEVVHEAIDHIKEVKEHANAT